MSPFCLSGVSPVNRLAGSPHRIPPVCLLLLYFSIHTNRPHPFYVCTTCSFVTTFVEYLNWFVHLMYMVDTLGFSLYYPPASHNVRLHQFTWCSSSSKRGITIKQMPPRTVGTAWKMTDFPHLVRAMRMRSSLSIARTLIASCWPSRRAKEYSC